MYFFTSSKKLKLSDHVCTLHSDEVVSLISGCESVVYSCLPMAVIFNFYVANSYRLHYNLWLKTTDIICEKISQNIEMFNFQPLF